MKYIYSMLTILGLFTLTSVANPIVIPASPTIVLDQNSYSYGVGGQFTAITSANGTFQTFCVDVAHTFTPGATYYYNISPNIFQGSSTLVSLGTAYLFNGFLSGNLPGYNFGGGNSQLASAGLLQDAIWGFENESDGDSLSYFNSQNPFYNDAVNQFGSVQAASAPANGAYGVEALNLYDGCGNIYQSQLISTNTVSEHGSFLVSFLGLLMIPTGLGLIKHRKVIILKA